MGHPPFKLPGALYLQGTLERFVGGLAAAVVGRASAACGGRARPGRGWRRSSGGGGGADRWDHGGGSGANRWGHGRIPGSDCSNLLGHAIVFHPVVEPGARTESGVGRLLFRQAAGAISN